jgi:hypothetical protein
MTMMLHAAAGLGVGIVAGALFFRALRLNAALYLGPGPAWWPVALHVGRLLLLIAVLSGAVVAGGAAGLLGAFGGVLIARAVALRSPATTP